MLAWPSFFTECVLHKKRQITLGVLVVQIDAQLAEITPWNLIKIILAQGSVVKLMIGISGPDGGA